MNEQELLELVNETHKWELKKTAQTFCRWDAENEDYIVELKARSTHYPTQIIEYGKFDALMEESGKTGKEALYIASTPKLVMCFNITELCTEGYNFNWGNKRLPSHTDFGKCNWVDKKVGYIDNNKLIWRINYEGTD